VNEEQWLTCDDPRALLAFLHNDVGHPGREQKVVPERKCRLFGVASCCRVWQFLADSRSQRVVEIAERYADGAATGDELQAAYDDAGDAWAASILEVWKGNYPEPGPDFLESFRHAASAATVPSHTYESAKWVTNQSLDAAAAAEIVGESIIQADLVRCIFGNPFRPVTFDPAWRSPDVLLLAQGIYDDHAFDRMPILADALQDAGCDNDDILSHCRNAGSHARGCGVVDLILDKS
jgi:hypothetical protein